MGGWLLRAFPTPAYLAMPATGVDISDHSIKYLRFKERGGVRRIDVFGEFPIANGIMVGGDVKDPEGLRRALAVFSRETNTRLVRASLSERKGYLYQAVVPKSSAATLRSVIEFGLEENVPLQAAESIFDIEVVGERAAELVVNVTAFPRRAAEGFAGALEGAGLVPLSFEMEPQAVARAVIPEGDRGTYMIVDFGETKTGLSIQSEGAIRFTSSIDIAGSVLTNAIIKHFGVDAKEATRIKNDFGLTRGSEKREFYDLLMSVSAALRDEINRHYIYWHTHEAKDGAAAGSGSRIEKIFLVGGNANIRGLADYLSISMRADVIVPSVWRSAFSLNTYIPPIDARNALRYATAVGLALRRST